MLACGAASKLWEMRLTPSRSGSARAAFRTRPPNKVLLAVHGCHTCWRHCQLQAAMAATCKSRQSYTQVFFERPVLCLGSEVCLRIGPESSVQLTTTYLDQGMRLGRGSRGSRYMHSSCTLPSLDPVELFLCVPSGASRVLGSCCVPVEHMGCNRVHSFTQVRFCTRRVLR